MSDEDEFTPRLGKQRSLGGRAGKAFKSRILRAAMLASGGAFGRRRDGAKVSRFTGARIGRGAGVAAALTGGDHLGGFRSRRVVVKASIVRLAGKGLGAARAHMRYVQRDGVTREGAPGQLYGADTDHADGSAFVDRAQAGGDARQFRFIVSPEDGGEYEDLKDLTRRLMTQAEQDLGTKLDWVAVDHFNSGHPHTHVIVRGRDDAGKDLIIAKDYMTRGLRERAADLVSIDLGPRTDLEIVEALRREVDQARLTSLDRGLLADVDAAGLVSPSHRWPQHFASRTGRLRVLERMGLATEVEPTRWRLAPGLELSLRTLGERDDIQRTLRRTLVETGVERPPTELSIYDPAQVGDRALIGRLVRRGLSDETRDRHFLVVDGVDGRAHYVEIGQGAFTEAIPDGAVVQVRPRPVVARPHDLTVAQIAEANGGRYSVDLHLRADPAVTDDFAQTHVRRLEALRRARAGVERLADGAWSIAPDHVDRVLAVERRRAQAAPVVIETLSAIPIEKQTTVIGATWLDRQLVVEAAEPLRDAGFGREVRAALAQRRQWLLAQNLAREADGRIAYRSGLLGHLEGLELAQAGAALGRDDGLQYRAARTGERIEGVLKGRLDLNSGRFAVVERARDFTLVPWKPVLDGREGQSVSGVLRASGVSWSLGRARHGPSIT